MNVLKHFPTAIQFCYPWRSYQADVIKQLDHHLKNDHLHLVAPPGSGKTVLGLEVMLRLNQPTLIIAPTLAIRNQWVDRFTELFLQQDKTPNWVSTNLRKPAFMTVTTYQGLHALLKNNESEADAEIDDLEETFTPERFEESIHETFIQQLLNENFQTLVLDEAHHLRTSWWKSLTSFKKNLQNVTTVALTATPPYDVNQSEWDKYIELCGPIDEEIEIAALVKEGDLCPHQDFIAVSTLSEDESRPIIQFRKEIDQFIDEAKQNDSFIELLEKHPWLTSDEYVAEKVEHYHYYISMLLFLKEVDSDKWIHAFEQLNIKNRKLPTFNFEWLEELFTGLLYKDQHINPKTEPLQSMKKRLSHLGALNQKNVRLLVTESMKKTFVQSTSKLQSISDIVSYEQQQLQKDLRLVILADYIYKDDLYETKTKHRLGVIPIFNHLRTKLNTQCRLGVLTGSIVIIPTDAVVLLASFDFEFRATPLKDDATYSEIHVRGSSNQKVVSVITALFSQGGIDTLVGTTALLGEGWDAPSVNRLILASYVGSFMLTNQMRGRAIRTDPNNSLKTANIWHLVCVDENNFQPGYDFESLVRRFDSLSGLDAELPIIVSGITRLRLSEPPFDRAAIRMMNETMKSRAKDPATLRNRWLEATQLGEKKREQIEVQKEAIPRPFYFQNTLKALFIMILSTIFVTIIEVFNQPSIRDVDIGFILFFGFLFGIITSSPYWWKAFKIFFQNASIESSFETVAQIMYATLYEIGKIETAPQFNKIKVEQLQDGTITCVLEHGQMWEQKLFFQALQQFVDPINSPRYILYRKTRKRFFTRHDYHSIPDVIGQKKGHAELLVTKWKKHLGDAEAIYTRNFEGREMLLHARMCAMSSKFVPKSERKSVWK